MLTVEAVGEAQQQAIGAALARSCPQQLVLYLGGELGAGKTTLVRGLMRGLGFQGAVKSPTYTLLESYEVAGRGVSHFDLYRLGDPEELEFIGLRDLLEEARLLLFEWPERGRGMLPPADLEIAIRYAEHAGAAARQIDVTPRTAAGERVVSAFSSELQSVVNQ